MNTVPRNPLKTFALVGVAGFVAERHLRAIRDVGGRLAAAVDPRDSVGVLDRYFPEAEFFTEFERFDRFLEKRRRSQTESPIDCLSICSPNYLHDAHVRLALRVGADAICEKPLVINPWNLDQLADLEREYQRRIFTVLQLRLHPVVQRLKAELAPAVAAAAHLLPPTAPASPSPTTTTDAAAVIDLAVVHRQLSELKSQLARNSPKARKALPALRDALGTSPHSAHVETLSSHLDRFDFRGATQALSALLADLPPAD